MFASGQVEPGPGQRPGYLGPRDPRRGRGGGAPELGDGGTSPRHHRDGPRRGTPRTGSKTPLDTLSEIDSIQLCP